MSQDSGSSGSSQKLASSFHDVEQSIPPGVYSNTSSPMSYNSPRVDSKCSTPDPTAPRIQISKKGVEQAKKRLRAFSIQKKQPLTQTILPKITSGTGSTVLIGKLCSSKVSSKPAVSEQDESKKPPKPPKPGSVKKSDSYMDVKKKTLADIEDMKRKMELVELGIPLGLICPPTNSENSMLPTKAMPTKAMPPIKSFLDAEQVDDIIREAKKAKAEGKEFKFDYNKLLPGYDNPFQKKKEDKDDNGALKKDEKLHDYKIDRDGKNRYSKKDWKKDRRDYRRYSDHRSKSQYYKREGKYDRSKERDRDQTKDKAKLEDDSDRFDADTILHLKDFVVCDSWSPSDKTSSPVVEEKPRVETVPGELPKQEDVEVEPSPAKPDETTTVEVKIEPVQKFEKLHPVMDSFTYEIDPDDDDVPLDIFDKAVNLKKFAHKTKKIRDPDIDFLSKDMSMDGNNEFLASVIKELKEEVMSDDSSQDKALVEYDLSPEKLTITPEDSSRSNTATPEIDNQQKDALSGFTSTESGCKSTESGYKSTESGYKSTESSYKLTQSGDKSTDGDQKSTDSGRKSTDSGRKSTESVFLSDSFRLTEAEVAIPDHMTQQTMDSLETWSFVMKICQPLLFRHDSNKCYRETHALPKLWHTENPKVCDCVRDRKVVYTELELCKMSLVDRVYGCDQISDFAAPKKRDWYPQPAHCLQQTKTIQLSSEWETEDSQPEGRSGRGGGGGAEERGGGTPQGEEDLSLDVEYQRFMDAVWPEISEPKEPRSTTPTKEEEKKKKKRPAEEDKKKSKKMKLSSEGWSNESEIEEDVEKSSKKNKEKVKTKKRKRSPTTMSETTDPDAEPDKKTKKKLSKKKANKKNKAKLAKRRKLEKKYMKKLKEKQKKKAKKLKEKAEKIENDSEHEQALEKSKKSKKKKQQKNKKKESKKKKEDTTSSSESSSSSDSDTSSVSEKEDRTKKKTKKKAEQGKSKRKKSVKKKKRKHSISESTQDEDSSVFDVNILNNIKTEKLTDDEKGHKKMADIQDFSPRRQQNKPRPEIIDMKELQNDLEISNMRIKEEKIDVIEEPEEVKENLEYDLEKNSPPESVEPKEDVMTEITPVEKPQETPLEQTQTDDLSQTSSQESTASVKQNYEKDDSHLRPSSQNSNYSFNDVMSSHGGSGERGLGLGVEVEVGVGVGVAGGGEYSYEMYEQMAMEYQSGVANQQSSEPVSLGACRIETVVSRHSRGEIKCDWRPSSTSAAVARPPPRPSRWGLKPGEANIVLTGKTEDSSPQVYQIRSVLEQETYQIESITGHGNDSTGYDEAYADMYAASDRLQYGDCFQQGVCDGPTSDEAASADTRTSLDMRIDRALRESVLGEVAKEENEKVSPEAENALAAKTSKEKKSVSFADGYKPGQDSDTEAPPKKKRRKRRFGCAWPCPASHPDHVPLWDALPPPPPPPSPPPPTPPSPPPVQLLRAARQRGRGGGLVPPHPMVKFDPSLAGMMPPEPPPGVISLQHLPL